jgi:hypothetical protein
MSESNIITEWVEYLWTTYYTTTTSDFNELRKIQLKGTALIRLDPEYWSSVRMDDMYREAIKLKW